MRVMFDLTTSLRCGILNSSQERTYLGPGSDYFPHSIEARDSHEIPQRISGISYEDQNA